MQLRPYQLEAVAAVYNHLRTRDNSPCVVIPTGGGKTPVIAQLCSDVVNNWRGRVCILAPSQELLEQTSDKLSAFNVPHGIYSAGLNRRDTKEPVIVAGIQSIYERAADFEPFDLILPDEAQGIPPEGEGRYRQFLSDARLINPNVRFVGLTATPFRMTSGPLCTPDGLLNEICYEVGVRQLIVDGYLSPLINKRGDAQPDTSGLHIRGGEFIAGEVEALMGSDALVTAACREIVEFTTDRKSILVFCAGIDHANDVAAVLSLVHRLPCQVVTGETSPGDRAAAVKDFKSGKLRCLVNVNVFTVGFDAPNVDCVVLLRPTLSPGLYYQMVGRGFRMAPGKADCLVLDFGGNVKRHGPIDALNLPGSRGPRSGEAPAKECPNCPAVVAAGYSVCPECGFQFPPSERAKHDPTASQEAILAEIKITRFEVTDTLFSVHHKRGAPEGWPPSMRVDYQIGLGEYKSEWLCFEHDQHGGAYRKAAEWWRRRSPDPIPLTVERAVIAARNGALADTLAVTVKSVSNERFDTITDYELGPLPELLEALPDNGRQVLEETPF